MFTDAAAWWRPEITLRNQDQEPVRVNTVEVSGNFLAVVGVRPILGAGFPAGVFYSRDRLVLMSHRLWESRFSADAAIVGKTIRLNDDQFTVAGVMPRGFEFPGDTDSVAATELGPDPAQPRRALHGGRRAAAARRALAARAA